MEKTPSDISTDKQTDLIEETRRLIEDSKQLREYCQMKREERQREREAAADAQMKRIGSRF